MRQHIEFEAPASLKTWLIPLALVGLGALGWACQDGGGQDDGSGASGGEEASADDPIDGEVTRRDVLQSIASNVLVPQTAAFADQSASLRSAVQAYAEATGTDAAADSLTNAQQVWRDTMVAWQELEVMQIGPAATSLAIGGEDLRDAIYSWPTNNSCSVDRALVDRLYANDDFFATELVWSYGLDALEYLLFTQDTAHTCPSQVQLDGPWAALSAEEITQRRADYAVVVAAGIADQATTLASRWSPDGDDFAAALGDPGQGSSPYADDLEALDEVFRGMFYVDKQTKDGKLGLPLGLIDGCPAVPCVDQLEEPWSGGGAAALAANLRGLQLLVQGGPDPETAVGFDDLLESIGQGQIADTLLADIDAAITTLEAFDEPLQQAIVAAPGRVEELHTTVKRVSDTLKGPLVMALMLTVPAEGAGDND